MLQNIRKNLQGNIAKVIIAIIIVPFALFGIESLLGGGGVQYVAEVNGQPISAQELQLQINQQKRRLLMTMGDNVDPSMLDDQLLAAPALEFIIQKTLLMQAADGYGLAVPDQALVDYIADMDVFKIDGRFDQVRFRQIVSDQGYTPAGFQQALRDDLVMTQLRSGVAGSTFATEREVAQLASINQERRDVRYMVLPLSRFKTEADISEEQIQDWYEQNSAQFMTEETVTLSYIELTPEDFIQPVEESALRELYELEGTVWRLPEQRRVSHILFVQGEGEDAAAVQARIAAAQARLASGESFADVAAELSDDVGSAGMGGDLDFTDGSIFPEPMEAAIAALELEEVSEPVETDAGFHLIQLTELREGKVRDFEEVRGELEARLQSEQASRELVKKAESLRDLVFNAEDLAGPAAELGLEVEQSAPLTRNQSDGLFANARLIGAAFSSDVLNEGYNSEVIEIDTEHFVVLRVANHKLPELKPLEQVREGIVVTLRDEAARAAIRSSARTLLAELRQGSSIEDVAQREGYEWQVELASTRRNPSAPATMLRRAFELPAPAESETTFEYVQNAEGDIELFELVRVEAGDVAGLQDGQRRLIERQLINEHGQQADEYFQQELRGGADISRT